MIRNIYKYSILNVKLIEKTFTSSPSIAQFKYNSINKFIVIGLNQQIDFTVPISTSVEPEYSITNPIFSAQAVNYFGSDVLFADRLTNKTALQQLILQLPPFINGRYDEIDNSYYYDSGNYNFYVNQAYKPFAASLLLFEKITIE